MAERVSCDWGVNGRGKAWAAAALLAWLVSCGPEVDVDGPQIEFTPEYLQLGEYLGGSATSMFKLKNVGNGPLELSLEFPEDWLEVSPKEATLNEGEQASFEVLAKCSGGEGQFVLPLRVHEKGRLQEMEVFAVRLRCVRELGEPTSAIELRVDGLGEGVMGRIFIAGPAGFEASLTGSTFIEEIYPGRYDLIVDEVQEALVVYRPRASEQTFEVPPESSFEVVVTYEAFED